MKFQKKRLLTLAALLKSVPREKFNMGEWFTCCGSPSCALGWATTIPSFRKAGLRRSQSRGMVKVYYFVQYKKYFHAQAAAAFFGIEEREAIELFYPFGVDSAFFSIVTPKQVARKIEQLVKKYERKKHASVGNAR